MRNRKCEHIDAIETVKVGSSGECEECIKTGGSWVHLRTCQTCGATLCCDDSPARHMTAHHHQTGHPVMASAQPDEFWLWCFPHKAFLQYGESMRLLI